MKFGDLPHGTSVFVDANPLVYAYAPDPQLGPECLQLLKRIEIGELQGFTSSHVLSDVAHRLMSLEACATFGWPFAGIAHRMNSHPQEVRRLVQYRRAIETIVKAGMKSIVSSLVDVIDATSLCASHGLLSSDALIVTLMRRNAITILASFDTDFDRVPGIQRVCSI